MRERTTTDAGDISGSCVDLKAICTALAEAERTMASAGELLHPNDDEDAAVYYAEIQLLADKVAKKAAMELVVWKSQLSEDVRNKVSDRIVAAVSERK